MITQQATILVVDDDKDLLQLLALRLKAVGYEVIAVDSGEKALDRLRITLPQLVITDVRMDGMDGFRLLDEIRRDHPSLPVIMLTAHGSIPDAVDAAQRGVFGFITKPFDSRDLLKQVERAVGLSGSPLKAAANGTGQEWRKAILTRSPQMEDLLHQLWLAAQGDSNIFLIGDTGTGKELIAQAIHRASPGRQKAFVTISCAAMPEELLGSELFGYAKGAFSGATRNYGGLLVEAEGGTLFIDDIDELPLGLQTKLLRAIQEKSVRALGASESTPINCRIISAAHQDIDEDVRAGRFREELYYRLKVMPFMIPALSERREDIPLLVNNFLVELAEKYAKPVKTFSPSAMEVLIATPFPGNIRQLRNIVEQIFTLCTTQVIPASLVQNVVRELPADLPSLKEAKTRFERDYILQLLRITGGNVSQSARLAKRNRTEFYKLLHRHQLDPTDFKTASPMFGEVEEEEE